MAGDDGRKLPGCAERQGHLVRINGYRDRRNSGVGHRDRQAIGLSASRVLGFGLNHIRTISAFSEYTPHTDNNDNNPDQLAGSVATHVYNLLDGLNVMSVRRCAGVEVISLIPDTPLRPGGWNFRPEFAMSVS